MSDADHTSARVSGAVLVPGDAGFATARRSTRLGSERLDLALATRLDELV